MASLGYGVLQIGDISRVELHLVRPDYAYIHIGLKIAWLKA